MKIGKDNIIPTLKWLVAASEGIRKKAFLNVAIGLIQVAFDFCFIYLSKMAIDIATGVNEGNLIVAAVLLVVISLSGNILGYGKSWVSSLLGAKSQNLMQRRTFSKIMHSVWNGRNQMHSGDAMNRMMLDSNKITIVITDVVPQMFCVCVRLVGAFFILFNMQPLLAIIIILMTPLFILASRFYFKRMRVMSKEIRTTESGIQSHIQENIQNRVIVKSFELTDDVVDKLTEKQNVQVEQVKKRTKFSSVSFLVLRIGFSAGYLITFIWGIFNIRSGAITYGMMMAFVQLVGQIQGPFRSMTSLLPQFVDAMVASERIRELEDIDMEESNNSVTISRAGVNFEDVCYAYPGSDRNVIDHFSYDFKPGSITAILGETGSGKTTLIRLILSLIKPVSGNVSIYNSSDKVPASADTRCNLVYVPQGNTLFSGTVRDNLLIGKPDATEDEMKDALKVACAEFILDSKEGLDTVCGEGGVGLSEGQAQRISIARSLLRSGSILLLDESTSALDAETEERLISNLSFRINYSSQTVIFITHRPSVLKYCTDSVKITTTAFS